jgi:uracil-DNA glycosylase
MRVSDFVGCKAFPCADVDYGSYVVPSLDLKPESISIVIISEAAPDNLNDYYYAGGDASFQQTTLLAFNDAGAKVSSMQDILNLGVYLTTAVKCGKTGYGIKAGTIKNCSFLLEKELDLFPDIKAYLLMGDVAIKAFNNMTMRSGEGKVIPAGSTYKIRAGDFRFQGRRVFPSYLQVGPSFNIEKSKRRMIAEDIAAALSLTK